ncbi:MAG: hypothetical protein JSS66_13705 [Armatimonadetes bacterium]|nr:hypothetical protein [Armatimonadota bacterium]
MLVSFAKQANGPGLAPTQGMVPVLLAAAHWEGQLAVDLMLASQKKYQAALHFAGTVEYSCTKSSHGSGPGSVSTDAMSYRFVRSGKTYEVRPSEAEKGWRGDSKRSSIDPFMVYDHELARWVGFRSKRLTERLLPSDTTGPLYLVRKEGSTTTVFVTYMSQRYGRFATAYAMDSETLALRSISTYGVIGDVMGDDEHDKGVLWNEYWELKDQSF